MSTSGSNDGGLRAVFGSTKAFLVGCVAFIAALTALYDTFYGAPLRAEKKRLEEKSIQAEAQISTQAARIQELQDRERAHADAQAAPVLIQPGVNEHVYGSQVEFDWDYKSSNSGRTQGFVLELVSSDGEWLRVPVLNPEQKTMTLLSEWLEAGRMYFWRVVPGHLANTGDEQTEVLETGVPSPFGMFTLHKGVMEKIESTNELRVGTSPTIRGVTNYLNKEGKVCGLDVELIHRFVEHLKKVKGLENRELKVTFLDVLWKDLLPALAKREVDLVISGMTKTSQRERDHPGVRFTNGYFGTEQILIGKREGCDRAVNSGGTSASTAAKDGDKTCLSGDLKGKTLGVIEGTTNYEAALFLAGPTDKLSTAKRVKGKFVIDYSYRTYSEIVHALSTGKIDRALVDDIFVKEVLEADDDIVSSKPLTSRLKDFYNSLLPAPDKGDGEPKEEFAIAVVDNSLREEVNNYLTREEVEYLKSQVGQKGVCSNLSQF